MGYSTHIFDCDGVLLASNAAKAKAFYDSALTYGPENAAALEAYHKTAGSIGREARFQHFFANILKRQPDAGELEFLMARCTRQIIDSTLTAGLVPGVKDYLQSLDSADCMVVSGIDSGELRFLLGRYDLTRYFSAIYGGPRSKGEILDGIVSQIEKPAVLYGDAEEDYLCAVQAEIDFVLVKSDSFWRDGPDVIEGDSRAREIADFTELLAPVAGQANG